MKTMGTAGIVWATCRGQQWPPAILLSALTDTR